MSTRQNRQRGNVLIAVAVIGLAATLSFAALMNHSIVLESRAVEAQLAEIRAYWAIQGHFNYALSRVAKDGLCANSSQCFPIVNVTDTEKAATLQLYLDEIANLRHFTYPEESANYYLDIAVTGAVDPDPTRHNYSGHLKMTGTFPGGQSTLPILSGLTQKIGSYELGFCAGMASTAALCGPISQNNDGHPIGTFSVKRLVRLSPGP